MRTAVSPDYRTFPTFEEVAAPAPGPGEVLPEVTDAVRAYVRIEAGESPGRAVVRPRF